MELYEGRRVTMFDGVLLTVSKHAVKIDGLSTISEIDMMFLDDIVLLKSLYRLKRREGFSFPQGTIKSDLQLGEKIKQILDERGVAYDS